MEIFQRIMFFDTHAHVASRQFDADRAVILQNARQAGVTRIVAPATDLVDCAALQEIAASEPMVHPTAGIHPCDAHTVGGEGWIETLRGFATRPNIAAIGEIGLDYFHPPPEGYDVPGWRAHQAAVLRVQLDLAVELRLNVILHNRESWDDLTAIVLPYSGRLRAVFHCFTGTPEQARQVIEAGHLVSFTGIITFKNPGPAGETARLLPDGAFMLETDSPYLAPVPHRGRRCEPAYVADTARALAAMRGASVEHVAAVTTRTAESFFRL
jgi:TatD DNase family protein